MNFSHHLLCCDCDKRLAEFNAALSDIDRKPTTDEEPGPLTRTVWAAMRLDEPTHALNRDKTVAVATDYYWNEDMSACPTGAKVQLLGVGGVASYGNYNGRDDFWVAWAPLPKRREVKSR